MAVTDIGANQVATSETVNAGDTLNVASGGTAIDTTVFGTENTLNGGTAIRTVLEPGGEEDVFGTAISTTVGGIGDAPHGLALLRACRERPCGCRAAEQRDELATFHLSEMHPIPHGPGAHCRVPDCSGTVSGYASGKTRGAVSQAAAHARSGAS